MLKLITGDKPIKKAQAQLVKKINADIPNKEPLELSSRGGVYTYEVHVQGNGKLWAFVTNTYDKSEKKFWNSFGILSDDSTQMITVEINISLPVPRGRIAGAFAEDESGNLLLVHTGAIGGGRKGIGKTAFLGWSGIIPYPATDHDGSEREVIPIAALSDESFIDKLQEFVFTVAEFKKAATQGIPDPSPARKKLLTTFKAYQKGFSGTKRCHRSGVVEYDSYHDDVVDEIRLLKMQGGLDRDDLVTNQLVDLAIKRKDKIVEIFEVKTGIQRQQLYTAIGQLLTHSAPTDARMTLVVPCIGAIPTDIDSVLTKLKISTQYFKLSNKDDKKIELI